MEQIRRDQELGAAAVKELATKLNQRNEFKIVDQGNGYIHLDFGSQHFYRLSIICPYYKGRPCAYAEIGLLSQDKPNHWVLLQTRPPVFHGQDDIYRVESFQELLNQIFLLRNDPVAYHQREKV
jgi:hypothetical protein